MKGEIMILIGDKEINEKDHPEEWNFYQSKMADIKKRKHIPTGENTYRFIDNAEIRLGVSGKKEPRKEKELLFKAYSMGVEWHLCMSSNIDGVGKRTYTPVRQRFTNKEILNPDNKFDAEKIFFYLFVSPYIMSIIKLENKEAEAIKKQTERSDKLDAEFMIMSTKSPIGERSIGNDSALRSMATAYFIPEVENIPIAILRERLFNEIEKSEKNKVNTKRGFKEFVDECIDLSNELKENKGISNSLKQRINIQKAIDIKLIDYVESSWKYENGTILYTVPTSKYQNPTQALEEFLNKQHVAREDFNKKVYGEVQEEEELVVPKANYIIGLLGKEGEFTEDEKKLITKKDICELVFLQKKTVLKKLGKVIDKHWDSSELSKRIFTELEI